MFTMTILGVDMEVNGTFDPGEPMTYDSPGYAPCFEIESISHKGEELEVDQFPVEMLKDIEDKAFEMAAEDYQ